MNARSWAKRLPTGMSLTLVVALACLAGCSGGLRAKFPTEEEVRGRLHRGMAADEVLATFGQPAGHQWVDVQLGGKVRYIAPPAARTKKEAGYAGFTVYFDRGKVWDWEVIVMNPSYEHRLLASTRSRSVLGALALVLLGGAGYVAFRRGRQVRSERNELLHAYEARAIPTAELPPEFQFITSATTLQTVGDKAGPHSRVTKLPMDASAQQQGATVTAFEYELPEHGAVIVMPEHPSGPESRIRAVLYRRPRGGT